MFNSTDFEASKIKNSQYCSYSLLLDHIGTELFKNAYRNVRIKAVKGVLLLERIEISVVQS